MFVSLASCSWYHFKFRFSSFCRDFTINALFYNINTKAVEDLTDGGLLDLAAGMNHCSLIFPHTTYTLTKLPYHHRSGAHSYLCTCYIQGRSSTCKPCVMSMHSYRTIELSSHVMLQLLAGMVCEDSLMCDALHKHNDYGND